MPDRVSETHTDNRLVPDSLDYKLAGVIALVGLGLYVRTLAPDILYGDSAEFQTLAYTLGMTHSTGYPVYLLLARVIGFLPIGTLAWRVNLFSALCAAVTLGGVYLLARYTTSNRVGAVLGSVALALSYTFWSQAIIAEVYTPAMAFLVVVMLLLWHWFQAPNERLRLLFAAALVAGLGVGVHLSVALIAPVAVGFVGLTLWLKVGQPAMRWRGLGLAVAGAVMGSVLFLVTFWLLDANPTPTSFYQVALQSSRSIWGLEAADVDTPLERFGLTVLGRQWQDAMFPEGEGFVGAQFRAYTRRVLKQEFGFVPLLCAGLGLGVLLYTVPPLGGFVLAMAVVLLFFILNYNPSDAYVFYLPTYIPLVVVLSAGMGFVLDMVQRATSEGRRYSASTWVVLGLLLLLIMGPVAGSRWDALKVGAATFVEENYVYPLYDLEEPRRKAHWWFIQLPDDAVVIMEWRALYSLYYFARVEEGQTALRIMEASPHGGEGQLADTLIQELNEALADGRPVYADKVYENMRDHFRVMPSLGGDWYKLTFPKDK